MRTTLNLDDDVAALLEQVREATGSGLKQVVNTALREGLLGMVQPPASRVPFRTEAVSLGRCYLQSLDDVADVLASAEGEHFK
jgi:hypothetical protein